MKNVYDSKQRNYRVDFFCKTILRGGEITRTVATCLEMGDADAVMARVYRRAKKNQRLMDALPKYVNPISARLAYEKEFVLNIDWTREDQEHAARQGWAIFTVDNGKTKIQRLDDPLTAALDWGFVSEEVLECACDTMQKASDDQIAKTLGFPKLSSDEATHRLVRRKASEGDTVCQKARKLHNQHNQIIAPSHPL